MDLGAIEFGGESLGEEVGFFLAWITKQEGVWGHLGAWRELPAGTIAGTSTLAEALSPALKNLQTSCKEGSH